jgi:cytochrome P450
MTTTDIPSGAAATPPADAPDYPLPRSGRCPFDPAEAFKELREEKPLTKVRLWNGSLAWLATRYDDVRDLLADPRMSSDMRRPGFPAHSAAVSASRQKHRTFLNMDDPDHAQQRRLVTRDFMIRRVEQMRPAIQQHVDELLEEFAAMPQPADLVRGVALPVTSAVISQLLGVPYDDHEFFQDRSSKLTSGETDVEEQLQAYEDIRGYLGELVARKRVEPGEDVITHLAGMVDVGTLTDDELLNMLRLLLGAGHETTANMIALGTLALLENPDQLALLRGDPSREQVAKAVEELLRYLTISHFGRRRVATEDIEISGTLIRAGEGVIAANDAANRDPDAFPNPDVLDLTRDARHHLTFGYGVHQCLGQPLARVELQVVYPSLFRRFPDLRLAVPVEELAFKTHMVFYGLFSMPVTW